MKGISKLMPGRHLRASRALGYALTLADYDGWEQASAIWEARLTPQERAALGWAALRSLEPQDARKCSNAVLGGAGTPFPPFVSPLDDAHWWADKASAEELDAYALAIVKEMAPARRAAFLDFVRERQAAA